MLTALMPRFGEQSRLWELGRSAQRLPSVWAALLLAFAFLFLSGLGLLPLLWARGGSLERWERNALPMLASSYDPWSLGLWLSAELILAYAGVFLFVALRVRGREGRTLATLGLERNRAPYLYLRGFAWGAAMIGAAVGLVALVQGVQVETVPWEVHGWATAGGLMVALAGWVVQGAAEEILSRGWLMQVVGVRYGPAVGVVASAVFSTVVHGFNPQIDAWGLLNLGLYALLAAVYALREGSLWGVCGLHAAWNWVQGNVLGLPVSGISVIGPVGLRLHLNAPRWLSGGAFGPEGGLAVTVVTLVALLVVLFWEQERPPSTPPG